MKRDLTKLGMTIDEAKQYGVEGEFYIPPKEMEDSMNDPSIIDYNFPPETQPGLWCDWCYNEKECSIEWSGAEKFYYYVPWLKYLIDNVFKSEYILNGEVDFHCEYIDDTGKIIVKIMLLPLL